MSVVSNQPCKDIADIAEAGVASLLQKTLLFVFTHAFTKDLLLLQPALEAVKQLLQVVNAF